MGKKQILGTALMVLAVLLWVGAAQGQRNMNMNQRNQMMRGGATNQFRMGGQVSPEEMLQFLKGQNLATEAQKLEGLMRDPSKGQELQQELGRLNRVYGMVIMQMEFDPVGGKRALQRIKLETEIQEAVKEVKSARGAAQTPAKNKLTGSVGKLYDIVLAEDEASLKRMEEYIRTGDINALMGMGGGRGQGMVAGRGQGVGAGRGQVGVGQGMGGQQGRGMMGMGGMMDPEQLKEQLAQRKKNIAAWKKNKAAVIKLRVGELLLDFPSFPWERGGMGMMRMFG